MDLASLTPEELYTYPAGKPPPGVTPNFNAVAENAVTFYVIGGFLVAAMTCFMLLRAYTKIFLTRKWQWADLTITIGYLGAIFYFITGVLSIVFTGSDRHIWDLPLITITTERFAIITWLSDAWPTLFFWMIRISFFLLFLELFYPFKWVRYISWVAIGVMSGFYLPYWIVQMYFTTPKHGESFIEGFSDPLFFKSQDLAIPLAVVGLFFDLWIFAVPIFAIQQLQMSRKTKFEVSLVFSTALIAIVASVVNLAYRIISQQDNTDYTYRAFPVIFCTTVEMCVGVTVFCMPAVAHSYNHRQRTRVSTGASTSKKNLVGGSTGISGNSSGNRTYRSNEKKSVGSSNDSRPSSVQGRDMLEPNAIRRDVEYGVSIEMGDVEAQKATTNAAAPWR